MTARLAASRAGGKAVRSDTKYVTALVDTLQEGRPKGRRDGHAFDLPALAAHFHPGRSDVLAPDMQHPAQPEQ